MFTMMELDYLLHMLEMEEEEVQNMEGASQEHFDIIKSMGDKLVAMKTLMQSEINNARDEQLREEKFWKEH